MGDEAPSVTSPAEPSAQRNPTGWISSRVRVGITLGLVIISLVCLGGWFWTAFVAFFIVTGFKELNSMMDAAGIQPSRLIVKLSAVLMLLTAALGLTDLLPTLLTAAIMASFFHLLFRHPRATIADIGATLLEIFYLVYLPVHYILLRNLDTEGIANPLAQPGLYYLMFLILVIGISDVAAYYIGKRFGKHLLYPEISPKKTKEGAIGGGLCAMLVGVTFAWLIDFPLHHAIILSLILVIVGQLGDLTESMLKRDAGLKDSGGMLQGHGGMLDRADSYIFSGAVCYHYIHWFVFKQGLFHSVMNWWSAF